MEIEALNRMNEGMFLNLMTIIEVMALFTALFAIASVAIYLAGLAWFWFEGRVPPRRRIGLSQQAAAPRSGRRLPLTSSLQ